MSLKSINDDLTTSSVRCESNVVNYALYTVELRHATTSSGDLYCQQKHDEA